MVPATHPSTLHDVAGTAISSLANHSTATFSGPLEAAIRLLAGRLGPNHTPSGLEVSGNITLEQLRAAFPGF